MTNSGCLRKDELGSRMYKGGLRSRININFKTMNSIYHRITALALLSVLILAPSVSFAKGNENKDKGKGHENKITLNRGSEARGKDEANTKKEKNVCLRAFGHLIAKGYIKNKGEVNFVADCFLPFGIKKKFGGTASTTDNVAPTLSNLQVNTNGTTARATWNTDEQSDTTVFWSTIPNFSLTSSSTQNKSVNEMVRDHSVLLENLSASTTYYLIVRSKDLAGNTATSSQATFTTQALPADTTAPVLSSIAYLSSTSTISMSWITNENANSKIYYSTTTPLDLNATTTANVFSGLLTQNHLLAATGLTASTTYYFAVESIDTSGNKTVSPSFTLMTR
jgi:hypothetical protein